jgi:hypothetical protein
MNKIRKIIFKFAIVLLFMLFFYGSAYAETLYIFYPSIMRPIVMQQKMTEACPGIEIKVFGRFKDFETEVISGKPDAILTKYPVISQLGGYSVLLKGSRKGKTEESDILLSVDEKIDLNSISEISIGMFDILGRDGMKKMVSSYFNGEPKLKLVSKTEDMLQLLTLNMSKAILIPENHIGYFKELSNLNFVVTPVPNMKEGIVALAIKSGAGAAKIVKALTGMNDKNMAIPEVDKWEQ